MIVVMVVIVLIILPVIADMAVMTVMIIAPGDRACPKPFFQDGFFRALATPVEPVLKILNLDDMRDFGISDLHGDCGQAAADVSRPLMPAHCGEGLRDGLRRAFPPSRPANARFR
jgi:hypothetical protein